MMEDFNFHSKSRSKYNIIYQLRYVHALLKKQDKYIKNKCFRIIEN